MNSPVCVIVGVGSGNGAAFVHRFAAEGYRVDLLVTRQRIIKTIRIYSSKEEIGPS